jgi:CDP-diacylglycerol--serine O-phosphatidyltransferase
MLRSFRLPDAFTFANASCGMLAIFLCLNYLASGQRSGIGLVFLLLPLALVFDVLDGIIARWYKQASALGADLDSLSDSLSFGVAPAVLGYTLGLRGGWDVLILTYFVACGLSRLARYNVTAATLSDIEGKIRYYEGVPIPANVILVLLFGLAFTFKHVGPEMWLGAYIIGPATFHPMSLLYAISGSLMISRTIRIPKPSW